MAQFDIFTDATSDLTVEQEKQWGLGIVPLGVTVKGKSFMHYPDERELTMKEFYSALRAGLDVQSSATPPSFFSEAIEKSLKAGRDALVIVISSKLSCGFQNAEIAAEDLREEYPQRRIVIVDSLGASCGLGLLVKMAADWRDEGRDILDTAAHVEAAKGHVCQVFTVDSLKHLRRGGRISAAAAIAGSVLSVKPIMNVDPSGKLIPLGTVRGRKKAIAELAARMKKLAIDPEEQHVFISQADCEEDAELLASIIRETVGAKEITINQIGPVVATHGGCGSLALFFIGKYRESMMPGR